MKAAVVRGANELRIESVPDPEVGDYDALCEILYGSICTGTDSHIVEGIFPWTSPLPTVLGHESVGRVVKVGPKVRNFREGDIVTRVGMPAGKGLSVTWGGFAEYGVARDHWAMCADGAPESEWRSRRVEQHLPHSVDPRVGPMFITWRETLSYLLRLGFSAGRSILVVGSGGNGLSFAAHASRLGGSRVAMIGSERYRKAAGEKAGVTEYVDYRSSTYDVEGGFDIVLDAVGKRENAERVLPLVAPGGIFAVYGIDDLDEYRINPRLAAGRFTVSYVGAYDESETHHQVSEAVMQGGIDASLWYDLDSPFDMEELPGLFADPGRRTTPKALIRIRG